MNILHVCANPKPTEESVSKQLASAFFGRLIELKPEVELVNVDLYDEKPPFYSYDLYKRAWYPVFNEAYEPTKVEEMALNYVTGRAEKFNNADIGAYRADVELLCARDYESMDGSNLVARPNLLYRQRRRGKRTTSG